MSNYLAHVWRVNDIPFPAEKETYINPLVSRNFKQKIRKNTITKNEKLSELTIDELYEEKKKRKIILSVIGIAMLIVCGILIFLATKNKNNLLYAVAIGCFITLMPSIAYLGQIEKEIKLRNKK